MQQQRPNVSAVTDSTELRRWYWTKEELLGECRRLGLRVSGGKFQLLDRIAHFHETGETVFPGDKKPTITSKFDWHSATLTLDTVITDSYKNSQNVRRFFKMHVGEHFKFNIASMAWMKENTGKTLADAVEAIKSLEAEAKKPGFQSKIADHNQFNQYTRDFLAANPQMSLSDVRRFWALKRACRRTTADTGMTPRIYS
ncbi:MAG: hypothetical protein HRU27_20895 [Rhizobiaceae bacterium]|nr:hypothetical protein [Rhizobiaceae bacterium]